MPESLAVLLELFARFSMVGATAFGGGGAAIPLVEQIAVADTGWVSAEQFALGVGFAYATPGPVLILAAFVGFHAAGVAGAVAGTAGVFAIPVLLAAGSAGVVTRLNQFPRFRAFGRFAGAAAVGLLAVTAVTVARPVYDINPLFLLCAIPVLVAERFGLSPVLLLAIAVLSGGVMAAIAG